MRTAEGGITVRSSMSFQAKRELLIQVAGRYRDATGQQKSRILDAFVAATGYARKYAIHLLTQPELPPVQPLTRPRPRRYGAEVQAALEVAWTAANEVCAKRLVPFLPDLVASLERHGHLTMSEQTRTQLLRISPATADRLLQARRRRTASPAASQRPNPVPCSSDTCRSAPSPIGMTPDLAVWKLTSSRTAAPVRKAATSTAWSSPTWPPAGRSACRCSTAARRRSCKPSTPHAASCPSRYSDWTPTTAAS